MFLFFPFYFICWNQMWNNLISQAGQMALHGTPNDLLQNLDPIALCIFIPFLDSECTTFSPILGIELLTVCSRGLSSSSQVQDQLRPHHSHLRWVHHRFALHGLCFRSAALHLQLASAEYPRLDSSAELHLGRLFRSLCHHHRS